MPKTSKIKLLVEVVAPARLNPEKVAQLVERLIDIGLVDAEATSRLPDLDDPNIELVLSLEIQAPKVLK